MISSSIIGCWLLLSPIQVYTNATPGHLVMDHARASYPTIYRDEASCKAVAKILSAEEPVKAANTWHCEEIK